ncbi:Basic transcription factor 3 [Dichanthelium oligosanthes]|uniref:Nascent polypeptide-associated complex subunit beta n=1 Tax=Dichanthelium oligosanthes TaxID=888268 RepID=A0A1E5V366_9POAL|nr:Basic transcription factor 3 [Dichanthelium oligosanthes]
MEEGNLDCLMNDLLATLHGPEAADGSLFVPPPLSSDGQCPAAVSPHLINADGSWALGDEHYQSMHGGDIMTAETNGLALEAEDYWGSFRYQWFDGDDLQVGGGGVDEQSQDPDSLLLDGNGNSSSSGANQVAVVDSSAGGSNALLSEQITQQVGADSPPAAFVVCQVQAGTNHPWRLDEVGADDSPPAAPATGPNRAPPEPDDDVFAAFCEDKAFCEEKMPSMMDMTMTLADMVGIAQECGNNDEAARRVWSIEEHQELLHRLHWYAKHDKVAYGCLAISPYLPKKTAMDIALRYRWLQNKEKRAKQAELVEKDSAVVMVKKGKGTKGAKKSNNMYPLSKEALDSKSTRELLRDSCIFMQQIEENIKTGELSDDTADYFYYVKTNIDAIGKRLAKRPHDGWNWKAQSVVVREKKKQGTHPPFELNLARDYKSAICSHSFISLLAMTNLQRTAWIRDPDNMNVDKLKKMAGAVRTGGKGSVRRKKKAVHKTTTTDDKRLQSTLKRIGVNTIPGIEEVNIFKDDVVIQFQNPKVQASIPANTWVVSGVPQTKSLQDLLPTIINQLGPDNLDNLRRLAEQFQKQVPGAEAGASAAVQDDDDVPELVPGETFEEATEEKKEPEPEEKKES